MEKVIRDGKVAVLISDGFGAGWYSWSSNNEALLFHPKLVEMVEQGKAAKIDEDWVKENLGIKMSIAEVLLICKFIGYLLARNFKLKSTMVLKV